MCGVCVCFSGEESPASISFSTAHEELWLMKIRGSAMDAFCFHVSDFVPWRGSEAGNLGNYLGVK